MWQRVNPVFLRFHFEQSQGFKWGFNDLLWHRYFCLGHLKDWKVTVLLSLSVQVQYSGPGSWEAAGVCWGIAGHWPWQGKELLHNSGRFHYPLACPRAPIFVSYLCPGSKAQTYFGFADDHTSKRISVQGSQEASIYTVFISQELFEGWLCSCASWPSSVTLRKVTNTFLKVTSLLITHVIPSTYVRGHGID